MGSCYSVGMRILVVATNIPVPGIHGGSTHVAELQRALAASHEVLTLARVGSRGRGVVGLGLGTARSPLSYVLAAVHFTPALAAARRFAPDVIYERFSAQGLGVLLGAALDVPVVSMVLDPDATELTLRGADRLVTTAPHLVPARHRVKVRPVRWGVDVDRFHPRVDGTEVRRRFGVRADELLVVYAGGFYGWHGLDTLVRAAEQLPSGSARPRFLLVGDGPARRGLERDVRAAGLEGAFDFAGAVAHDDMPRYVAAADVCVAPYDPEGHPALRRHGMFYDPLKVFEYLACEKPTVTLDCASFRRLFRHGRDVVLVPPGDPAALARALDALRARPERGRALGKAGRRLVERRFTWRGHARELTGVFEQALAERPLRRSPGVALRSLWPRGW